MSIPLIQDNQKDSINASLIAIKREEERLQALIAEADKKIAQLNELKVNKSDIVDEVTLNNMQSVTSNAVAEGALKWNGHILKTIDISFPANTTVIDISNITYSRAFVLAGAVYGSFGTRPIDVGGTYVTNSKQIQLQFNNDSWRTYTGSLILGYYV